MRSEGYTFAAGQVTPDVAKMLPKLKHLAAVVMVVVEMLEIGNKKGREDKVVFAEGRKMLAEDIEGLKKYI